MTAMRFLRFAPALLLAAMMMNTATADPAKALSDRVEVANVPNCIVVGLRDFDLIKQHFAALQAQVVLADANGKAIDTFRIDYADAATPSHVALLKRDGVAYAAVRIIFTDGGRGVATLERKLPAVFPAKPNVPKLKETAALERGTGFDAADAPAIQLPDRDHARALALGTAPQTVAIAETKKRVTADYNFPTGGEATFVSRSSDSPDRFSIYVSLNSDLYDPPTGAFQSPMKYLAELPADPAWIAKAGDSEVYVPANEVRIHMTTEKRKFTGEGMQRITGEAKGLLGQTMNSTALDDRGNIYFAIADRSPIRFNVTKQQWESPPVNVYDYLRQHLPAIAGLPYLKGYIHDLRIDFANDIQCHKNRIWVMPTRYMIFGDTAGRNSLFLAFIVSIPVDHWDDKVAFLKDMRLNACSTPKSPFPLWGTDVERNDHQRKIGPAIAMDNRFGVLAYHRNYFWIMDVADDGSTKRLVSLKTFQGKPIEEFSYASWAMAGDKALGMVIPVRIAGAKKLQDAFLPMGSDELTDAVPKGARIEPGYFNKRMFLYNFSRTYGTLRTPKRALALRMGKPTVGGDLTIYYDAVTRLRADKSLPADIVEQINASSMGPEYYCVTPPGKSMEVLGAANYPSYNLARYDCSAPTPTVHKIFLERDVGNVDMRLNTPAGCGPYCHAWFREGDADVLYYAGYTGVFRLLYSQNGKVSAKHKPQSLFGGGDKHACIDGAADAYIKWFRDMRPGLRGKVFVTGTGSVSRGGTAYSGGLMYFNRGKPEHLYKLSAMSRSYSTTALAARMAGVPGGAMQQDIFLNGNYSANEAETLPAERRPSDTAPRVFVYRDDGRDAVHDLYGFTLAPKGDAKAHVGDLLMAGDGRHLLMVLNGDRLAAYDVDQQQFSDIAALPGNVAAMDYRQRNDQLFRLPEGGQAICIYDPAPVAAEGQPAAQPTAATFVRVTIDAAGTLALTPLVRCTFADPLDFVGPMTLLYDHEKNDGSYDLIIGPSSRKPEGTLKIIRDFLPPRPEAVAAFAG